ncbi:MAG: transcriptional regulator [Cyanobacteria bacterium P01_D01_bin.1]
MLTENANQKKKKAAPTQTENGSSPLTRNVEETFLERVYREPELVVDMLAEAISLFVNGESDISRLMLRDIVNATMGFEQLAIKIGRPSKSLHRMLSQKGNPTMDNLVAIIGALRHELKIESVVVSFILNESIESVDCSKSA